MMTSKKISRFLAIGLCGAVLASCSTNDDNTADSSTTETKETQSADTTISESSSATSEASSTTSEEIDGVEELNNSSTNQENESTSSQESVDVSSELKMNSSTVLLPADFPTEDPSSITADIATNEADSYIVSYTDNQGELAEVSGTLYESYEAVGEENGLNEAKEIKEEEVDLGYRIMGDEEGGAGHFLLYWKEGRWYFNMNMLNSDPDNPDKITSDSENEGNIDNAAKEVVGFLESNELPVPHDKGTISMNYGAGEGDGTVSVKWQDQNVVYEVSASRVPIDALTMVVSMK